MGLAHLHSLNCGRREEGNSPIVTLPEAFSNAATISRTDVPCPVPKLYAVQPNKGVQRTCEKQESRTLICHVEGIDCKASPMSGVVKSFRRAAMCPSAKSMTWM